MTVLTNEQLAALNDALVEREHLLADTVQERTERLRSIEAPDMAGLVGDVADRVDLELERNHESAAVSRGVRELRAIEATRRRIAAGEAGLCVECWKEIGFARLTAQPTAARCLECQIRHEYRYSGAIDDEPEEPWEGHAGRVW